MAELKKNKNKLAAFTLFESVVAIAIISVLIGLATIIYSNLVEAERPIAFYQAKEKIDECFYEMKKTGAFFPKNFVYENYSIEQKVDFYNGNKKIYLVEFVVMSQNKKWWTEKHLIANNNYEN